MNQNLEWIKIGNYLLYSHICEMLQLYQIVFPLTIEVVCLAYRKTFGAFSLQPKMNQFSEKKIQEFELSCKIAHKRTQLLRSYFNQPCNIQVYFLFCINLNLCKAFLLDIRQNLVIWIHKSFLKIMKMLVTTFWSSKDVSDKIFVNNIDFIL